MKSVQLYFILGLFLFATAIMVTVISSDSTWAQEDKLPIGHTTDQNCQSCHSVEWQDWQGSHHQKSMALASEETVLGTFDNEEVIINGDTSRFYKKDAEFWVNTENTDYKIEYVFGFEPLQQYLIKKEGGKYQTLPLSWDSRSEERGGQRWFHVYGEDHISPNDRLHWQQPLQNWNGMCADCHSTGLERNYDAESNSFDTKWSTINVSCASCHDSNTPFAPTADDGLGWILEEGNNTVSWLGPKRDQSEIEVCAACHSRRAPLTDGFTSSDKFLDTFTPSPILSPEYFPDGQIRDEVYVWGSFMQSKMFSKGVVCSDCHDPHSLQLKATGNQLCAQCHEASYFDTTSHTKHEIATPGAQCVDCHMASRTYMGVDDRRDHSFRIPRPDLNHKTSSPDACTSCHMDQTPEWAGEQINGWNGNKIQPIHYGEVLNKVFLGEAGAEAQLKAMLVDEDIPVIIRGSAYSLLTSFPNENSASLITQAVTSDEPLIRLGAVRGSEFIPLEMRLPIISPLLNDEFKAVRVETVRALSGLNPSTIEAALKQSYQEAEKEFLIAQNQTTWRGEGHFNLGLFYNGKDNGETSKQHYQDAIRIDPYFPASYINLADLYRSQGKIKENTDLIDQGLAFMPNSPDLNFSKALHLIRLKQAPDALDYLDNAVSNAPNNAYYAYVYAVALTDMKLVGKALNVLTTAVQNTPNDGNINMMLLNHYTGQGNFSEALKFAEKLAKLFPGNQMINQTLMGLRNRQQL
ncbi:MAG: hypothetical protein HOH19_01735 [Kordiimonadaceae bacterium]|jgi:predicted CXXCH cytochrome family protein|nr:hypothetical protein [Kordiimonadaceae bacterium]